MQLHIKNMVCARCKMAVENLLEELNIDYQSVSLGVVTLNTPLTSTQKNLLEKKLEDIGFAILDDKRSQIVGKIKNLLIELVQKHNASLDTPLSTYLAQKLAQDYHHLSSIFSQQETTTIEQYFILLKIERVKELLVYDEMNLKEISYLLNYSSVAHLSKQFKKVTGLTPTHFKSTGLEKRKLIDKL